MGGGLTDAQRRVLDVLAPAVAHDFYLAGGVAVALRLHHRQSHDLGLFAPTRDPTTLEEPLGPDAHVVSRAPGTLHLEVAGVPVSLLRYRYPLLRAAEHEVGIAVPVASREDLVAMKLSAIASRGAKRDFWDLHALLGSMGLPLPAALGLFQQKYAHVDMGHVVRALVYFADADAEPTPPELSPEGWLAIQRDFTEWVPRL